MYLVAMILAPLALLLKGRVIQTALSLLAQNALLGWPIAAIWTIMVASSANADAWVSRPKKLERAVRDHRAGVRSHGGSTDPNARVA